METQWVAKSLTVWGVIVAVLTAAVPAIAALFPDLASTVTPEWVTALDINVKAAISAVGVLAGSVMVIYDRIKGTEVKKTLTLRRDEYSELPERKAMAKPKTKIVRKKVIRKPKK